MVLSQKIWNKMIWHRNRKWQQSISFEERECKRIYKLSNYRTKTKPYIEKRNTKWTNIFQKIKNNTRSETAVYSTLKELRNYAGMPSNLQELFQHCVVIEGWLEYLKDWENGGRDFTASIYPMVVSDVNSREPRQIPATPFITET